MSHRAVLTGLGMHIVVYTCGDVLIRIGLY